MEGILKVAILLFCCQSIDAIAKYYMDTNCGRFISFEDKGLSQIKLYLTRHSSYQPNMHCTLAFNTSANSQFMLYFNNLNVETSTTCSRDWLDVRDGTDENAPYVYGLNRRLCGYINDHNVYRTTSNGLFLMFTSDNSFQYGGFQMIITSYHTGTCGSHEYDCDNGRCINDDLMCNGQNPCGDYSDCPLAAAAIAGIVIGCLVFAFISAAIVIIFCRRRRRLRRGYVAKTVVTQTYGTSGYNQPVPQQYPSYPTGQQYPQQPYPQQ